MKKVLLLGDSIRMGYCENVRQNLADVAQVFYPDDNGRFTVYTLRHLQDWVSQLKTGPDVDVVHWNNGLWDAAHLGAMVESGEALATWAPAKGNRSVVYETDPVIPGEMYAYFIRRICDRLRFFFPKAVLIFADTTPVLEEQCPVALMRSNAEIRQYNELAHAALAGTGTRFNDLYDFAEKTVSSLHRDWCHYDPEGNRILGEEVAGFIRKALEEK